LPFLLIFILTPIVEMYVLIRVGQWIGAWPTIGLVTLTAFIGLALLRQQGFSTLLRGRRRLEQGELPAEEMVEGLMLAIGGALLLTPGFVTDTFGFACLLPPTRRALAAALLRNSTVHFQAGGGPFGPGGPRGGFGADPFGADVRRRRDGHHDIEGEWVREDDRERPGLDRDDPSGRR
jgi:UPF0716 protein FxsA